jgi:hypothetical protein
MFRRLCAPVVLAFIVAAGAGCTSSVDLAKSVAVTDVLTGWHDFGLVNGENKLVPSISFRLQNTGTTPLSGVEMLVAFWAEGADGESDSKLIIATREPLAPGASTNLLTVRSEVGATSLTPRAQMFNSSYWKDFTAKLVAKRAGKFVKLGEYRVDRRLLAAPAVESGTK